MRVLAILVALVCSVSGCKKSDPAPKITCAYYWSVEKDGNVTHLLGTVHGAIEASQLPRQVWDDFDRARTLVVEADVNDPTLLEKVKRGAGPSLRDELGPTYWSKLEAALGAQTANAVEGMKTFMATVVLVAKAMPRQVPEGMDAAFLSAAKKQRKQIVFLEETELQLQLLEKHLATRELKLMLDDPKGTAADMQQLVSVYLTGDEAALAKTLADQRAASLARGYTEAELEEQRLDMFDRRNQQWIAPIEGIHAAGGGFVAVGSGHLVGPGSVTELLAGKGYTLKRTACATATAAPRT